MEARILNFPEALRLASILSPYIHLPEDAQTTNVKLVGRLIKEMSPMDYLNCIKSISTQPITGNETGESLLSLVYEGFEKNKILSLVSYYREIGIE